MARHITPDEALRAQLVALGEGLGVITAHGEETWASITFAGTRHKIAMAFEGDDAVEAGEKFIAFLPEHDFAIDGQLVADACVSDVDHTDGGMVVRIEVLMIDETEWRK